ncbi:Na+/H+ antiporter subunit E [Candidatus Izimaplasma bacterium]|nr:Na+/H+ antiporter subunit E [Candidatus Izimaplasma bacterium]
MKYVGTFLVLFIIYVLLAGFVVQELILGAVVSLVLTLIIAKYVNYEIDGKLPLRLLQFIFVYLPVFLWQLVLANIDVAKRVLSPKIPLNPGIIKVPTELKGDFAKLTLANSITLTPGTLSIDVDGENLYVHTIFVKGETEADKRKNISSPFEKLLGGIFK